MASNPNVNKVVYGGTTLIDITDTTATENDVAQGKVFYKADGSRAIGTGGGIKVDLLWTNESPSTGFAAQTISLDLSSYKLVLIPFRITTGAAGAEIQNSIFVVGETASATSAFAINRGREVTVTTSGVTFEQGYGFATYANGTKGNANGNLIPQKIYGIK